MIDKSDFERFCSFDAMYDASYKVCRNVRWKDSTITFEENRIDTTLKTQEDLRAYEYRQLLFSCFMVIERGKPREIRACHINDRQVQNSLCDQVLLPELTPKFIYDNCATLPNKGIDFALNRAKKHMVAAFTEYGNPFYILRIDIKKYFDSIDHETLKRDARELIKDDDVYNLVSYLIDTFEFKVTHDSHPLPNKPYYIVKGKQYKQIKVHKFHKGVTYFEKASCSLGLGSQTSQLFALLTLNKVDHFIKEKLRIKYYGRYMDDLYLMHNDLKYLQYCKSMIEERLRQQGLRMNQNKTTITKITPIGADRKKHAPFKYLKWNFYITENKKIIQLPFKDKLAKERIKLRKMAALYHEGTLPAAEIQEHYFGWRTNMQKGSTFYIIQNMDNYFRSLFKGVEIHT